MSMNVNTTGTVYGSYQNTYKAGTVDKKKETVPVVFTFIDISFVLLL